MLNKQLGDRSVDEPSSLQSNGTVQTPTQAPAPSNIGSPGPTAAAPGKSDIGATTEPSKSIPPPVAKTCAIDIGIKLFCGSDGLLRL